MKVEELASRIYKALNNPDLRAGIQRAVTAAETSVEKIFSRHPWLAELAEEVRRAREEVLGRLDHYVDKTMHVIEEAGGHAYLARDAGEANRIVGEIVGTGRLVVKAKSMVTEEIGLREHLEELGNEVWETDLGELIIQLAGEKPMHAVVPALHLSREKVEALLRSSGILRGDAGGVEDMVAAVRAFLREKFCRADVGISGANAIAADTGAVLLVENEGNIRLVTGLPPVHVVVAGVEKIVPTMEDAYRQVLVQAAYAGLYPPTYVNVISGPSSTADVEYVRVRGAHGPRELHVVLLDNGRIQSSGNRVLAEQLLCIRCGRCQIACPLWRQAANIWGTGAYGGPMGVAWTAITRSLDEASALAMLCLGCLACQEACPMDIRLPEIMRWLKSLYARRIRDRGP